MDKRLATFVALTTLVAIGLMVIFSRASNLGVPVIPTSGGTNPTVIPTDGGTTAINVGVAVVSVTRTPNGQYQVTYRYTLTNTSNQPVTNLTATNLLNAVFGNGYTINSVSGTGVTVNSGFNGDSNSQLLASGNTLAAGGSATVEVTLTFTPQTTGESTYINTVQAFGLLQPVVASSSSRTSSRSSSSTSRTNTSSGSSGIGSGSSTSKPSSTSSATSNSSSSPSSSQATPVTSNIASVQFQITEPPAGQQVSSSASSSSAASSNSSSGSGATASAAGAGGLANAGIDPSSTVYVGTFVIGCLMLLHIFEVRRHKAEMKAKS